ncbi:MAG: Sid related protein, partial [Pseudomonadota bacterium]
MKRVSSSSTMSPIDTPSTETTLERAFESTDLANLFENEHNRYLKNSAKIGHGLITQDKSLGCEIIRQYNIPISSNPRDPKIRPLQDVEAIERFGMRRYRAHSPDGTRYYATRFIDVAFDDPHGATHRIACFSPPPKNREEPFWTGRTEPTRFWNTDLKEDHNTAFEKEKDTLKTIVKGGEWLKIEPESIRMRNEIKNRNPDQNTVMGESACDAYAAFLDEYQEELDADIRDKFTKAISAPLKDLFKSQTRPEWLHLYGYSLTPMHINPQRQDNLGAAPKWSNTCMMVLERMARWFALNRPHAIIQIRSTFEMLLDSELAKHIDFEVSVEEKGRFLRLFQSIDPFQAFPPFPKASDLAQGTAITYQVLNNIAPISTMPVKHSEFTRHNTSPSLTMNEKTNAEHAMMKPNELNTKKKSTSSTRETKEQLTEEQNTCKKPLLFTKSYQGPAVITSDKKDIPEKSVIKVFSTSQYGDYDSPWTSSSPSKHTGSGFVVEHENQKYIVTNAHVVSDSKRIQVKIANENKKFSAEAIVICYQSDLALLKVSDQEFLNAIQPVVIGDMVRLQDKVRVIGFPMGGSEISVTKGIVSRIEVETYETGNVDMLQVQIDAAINPGNSGGPVFSNGKVVGVAFQGLMFADNLGYIIPAPILKHFLHEVFSSHHYQGFPELPIKIQTLENKHLRELYHMTPDQTGVRIA